MYDDDFNYDDLCPRPAQGFGDRLLPEVSAIRAAGARRIAEQEFGRKLTARWPALHELVYIKRVAGWADLLVWRSMKGWWAVAYIDHDMWFTSSYSMPENAPFATDLSPTDLKEAVEQQLDIDLEVFLLHSGVGILPPGDISGQPRVRYCVGCRHPFRAADEGHTRCNSCKSH